MGDKAIVPVSSVQGEIERSPEFRQLLWDCREIWESLRLHDLKHYWLLGERLCKELPETREETYGVAIRLALSHSLGIDRATLWRCMQFYRAIDQARIFAVRRNCFLTWSKWKMLLPLEEDDRNTILARIESGELRTDDDVKAAVDEIKIRDGAIAARSLPHLREALPNLSDRLYLSITRGWDDAAPTDRAAAVKQLIPEIGIQNASRAVALRTVAQLRAELTKLEGKINGVSSRKSPTPGHHDQRTAGQSPLEDAEA